MVDISNKQLLEKIIQELNHIKEEGKTNKEELKLQIHEESQKVLERLEKNTSKINALEQRYNGLEIRCKSLEKLYKKNNIVIFGLEVTEGSNLLQFTIAKLYELLGIEIHEYDINNIYKIKSGNIPPIKIEFVTYLKKEIVFKNVHKLKGTKIFIAHDLSKEDRENQKLLTRHLKAAKQKNYLAKIKAKELHVNGEVYTLEQLRQFEESPENQAQNYEINEYHSSSNSAPPTPSVAESNTVEFVFKQKESLQQSQITSNNTDRNNTIVAEKRTNTSPADPRKEEEKRKLQRTNSTSSAKSEKSERTTRQNKLNSNSNK